ncbi:hypothetical protein EIL87_18350 [Saccharopolyspora rhizosphaerae]|uniref:Uncharacterized protein n=1 Tax=Saccharopolyspora rhizosphaerae TaxID=2492662 RepID=A0A426JN79_9PSEU|nr:hypothetical protein EIL87_18350 [Saccharopolyspora rhizosphaerae]
MFLLVFVVLAWVARWATEVSNEVPTEAVVAPPLDATTSPAMIAPTVPPAFFVQRPLLSRG